jgi:hypothetical protein
MALARERTGLHDFGTGSFREGLERFLASMAQDAELTREGADQLLATLVARLCNRLQIEDWYRAHPEIEQLAVEQPLFITGLPRTGTSALANMLSLEPAFRCLRAWEQEPACPPPTLELELADPRRLAMQRQLREMREQHPEQMVMHLYELDAATEDPMLLGLEFKAQTCTAPTFGYHAWWRDCDMRPAYAYQRRVIRLLQSRRPPNRWLFKAPHYAFHLPAVLDAYPDARFVITHRDPVKALPSWASLVLSLYPPGSVERIGAARVGPHLAAHQAIGMRRAIDARRRLGQQRFLDVHQRDFTADPMGTVARVYAFAGLRLAAGTRERMEAWSRENRPGAHGVHRYTPEQFGLDAEGLRKQFEFYTDAYGIPLEA